MHPSILQFLIEGESHVQEQGNREGGVSGPKEPSRCPLRVVVSCQHQSLVHLRVQGSYNVSESGTRSVGIGGVLLKGVLCDVPPGAVELVQSRHYVILDDFMFWSPRNPDFEDFWQVILKEGFDLVTPHHRVESLVSQNVELKVI
jgi:hypothetical protein